MQTVTRPGTRYTLAISGKDGTTVDTGIRVDVIADAIDYAQEIGLTTGNETIITDHDGGRPVLAVRIADQHP